VKRLLGILALAAALLLAVAATDRALPPPLDRPLSTAVLGTGDRPLTLFTSTDGYWRLPADTGDIDPRFIEALIALEDRRFRTHSGVDPVAVLRAARSNLLAGEVRSGASTLTMQLARLLEPRPRTFGGKLHQAVRALQIERRLSKDEILALYLTLAPYGGNLEGVRAASLGYFGKEPRELTDSEIALLLALPQAPEARRPDRRPSAARAGRADVLRKLAAKGLLPESRAREAMEDALPSERRDFPDLAWHLAHERRGAGGVVRTMIDTETQGLLERFLARRALDLPPSVQLSALVIRREDRTVRALAGSAVRSREGGWLDLTTRKRSPGSTLKPLIYGLAFDEGIAQPGTVVADLPVRFGSYAPRNFARDFSGELTLTEALQHSLNVPAVLLLDRLKAERLTGVLNLIGVTPAAPLAREEGQGLALALGGLGLSARDLGRLYAGLAEGGIDKPLAYTPAEAEANREAVGTRFMAAEAAGEVLDILRSSPSVQGRIPAALTEGAPRIAFKTGTSYGYRDAWAVGVGAEHVIVVWAGRPDGGARPGKTGRQAALPLLFELFDAIEPPRRAAIPLRPLEQAPTSPMQAEEGPTIVFPPPGSKLWPKEDGSPFVLAGRGNGTLRWYADGEALRTDRSANVLWNPAGPGFYEITLVDAEGRSTTADVRVK
jgi:penicillin-binding protein 1C